MSILKRIGKIIKSNINGISNDRECVINIDYDYDYACDNTQYQESEINKQNTIEAQYYANLELHYGASYEEIRRAYRESLKQYHPDLHNSNAENKACAEKITQKLNEAFTYFEDKFNRGELK